MRDLDDPTILSGEIDVDATLVSGDARVDLVLGSDEGATLEDAERVPHRLATRAFSYSS